MKVEEECIPCILKMSLNGLRSLNLEPYKLREIYHEFVKYIMADNDIIYDETVNIGFLEIAQVITNGIDGPLPGTVLSRCSQEFLQILNSVDMVIVKGGGNFESLIGEPNLPLNTFFLLMCKCEVHSRFFNSPVGQAILWYN